MKQFHKSIQLIHGKLEVPAYLPDATFGVVRSVDAVDLLNCHVEALVMNTFHLMQRPGSTTVHALGGLHGMSGFPLPIVTDSGGFQAYSLIHQNPRFGSINDKGLSFKPDSSKRVYLLSPEKSVQLQISYGSDVVICLDDCTHVDAPDDEQLISVKRTIEWAKRSKASFEYVLKQKLLPAEQKPRLFAVIQGGGKRELRRHCAEALLEIGFDGYGFGGWPLDSQGNLLADILGYTRELIPEQYPMHALGIGHPKNVLACYEMGYQLFDSAMPTRDARHGRLYTFNCEYDKASGGLSGSWFDYLYIQDERHIKADEPVSPFCDCLCCRHYSRGYLRHLFKMNDSLFPRLATIHNLRFMTLLTERLRTRDEK